MKVNLWNYFYSCIEFLNIPQKIICTVQLCRLTY